MPRRRRALVAMSGGVDSSVAAALMVEAGYDVTGVMLKLWRGEAASTDSGCCNVGAAEDARRVADALGIPFYVLNFAERFEDSVVRDFHEGYAAGRTPNPCVRCNQWIKFGTLMERADALDADFLVTGHYARLREGGGGGLRLLRGVDRGKDQSYVLWMLTQSELRRTRFPIGEMHKSETRAIAGRLGLRTAAKPDSQEICFVRGGDTSAYISENIAGASQEGPVLDRQGVEIGRHKGVGHYTVGQRKGLGVALGRPVFVTSIDPDRNAIVVGDRDDLAVEGFTTSEASFVAGPPDDGTTVLVQQRAHGDVDPARLYSRGAGSVEVVFDRPVGAVAPGQSAAFYSASEPDELIGGGVVARTAILVG